MASQPIKGLAIDGLVKKEFSATCDFGTIEYRSEDYEVEDYPVLVVTDADATSITLTCPKQIRCYEVRVYFLSNPASTEEETGVESGHWTKDNGNWTKVLHNGQLYILSGEKIYSAQGVRVR